MGIRSIINSLCEKSAFIDAIFGPSIFTEDLALNKRMNEELGKVLKMFNNLPLPELENKEVQDE